MTLATSGQCCPKILARVARWPKYNPPMSMQIYLASQSPRRRELLRQIGLAPIVLPLRHTPGRMDVDEAPLAEEKAQDYVQRLARAKAEAGLKALAGRQLLPLPIVTADTTVTLDGAILGKPADAGEAAAMLRRYSGRSHTVLTAVGVAHRGEVLVATSVSEVRCKPLTEVEIAAYVASREPYDKAGGYGIQGLAAVFVEHLSGSYSGVMGLPLFETAELLREVGFNVL
jgi:septum formation protein